MKNIEVWRTELNTSGSYWKYLSNRARSVDYLEKSSEQGQVLNLASAKRKKKNPSEKKSGLNQSRRWGEKGDADVAKWRKHGTNY